MHSGERGLGVLVRWPEPGGVLPRLTSQLGSEAAAQVYEAFIGDLVAAMPLGSFDSRLYCLDHEDAFRKTFPGVIVSTNPERKTRRLSTQAICRSPSRPR